VAISSLGITLDDGDSIELSARRSEHSAWMRIDVDGGYCEIYIERIHLEALNDQLPGVLADLDRAAADDAACGQAELARGRAADAAGRARDLAKVAAKAGAPDIAAVLLAAADEITATAKAVDAAVQAVETAAEDADRAADQLAYTTQLAIAALNGAPSMQDVLGDGQEDPSARRNS